MTLRVEFPHRAGTLGAVLTAIGDAEGMVGAVDIVRMGQERNTRDITVNVRNSEHGRNIVEVVEALPETRVVNISDRTFLMHLGERSRCGRRCRSAPATTSRWPTPRE